VMNLSLALPLTVGRALANQVYLEDTILNADNAKNVGLVNHVEPSKQDAENYAHRIAESLVLSQHFDHGPVSYLCGESTSHNSLENELAQQLGVLSKANQRVKVDIGNVSSATRMKVKQSAKPSKVWSIEEIQSEVEAAVRKVIAVGNSNQIDHHASLMDEGLDSLGTTELSDILQSRFGIELPSTFVFNNPTIAEMSNHLFKLLTPGIENELSDTLQVVRDRSTEAIELATMRKPKLLCLHGAGSNDAITSHQTMGLKLSTRFECIFAHAPHITNCFPGLDEYISGPCYSWASMFKIEADLKGQWDESLEYIAKLCIESGPFDGVYGFSQGAAIVTNFSHPTIWKDRFQMEKCPWKFAIIACGTCDYLMTIEKDRPVVLPSFHILGEKDLFFYQSEALSKYWDPFQKVTHTHNRGHDVDSLMWTRETEMMALLDNFLDKHIPSTSRHGREWPARGTHDTNARRSIISDTNVMARS